MANETEQDATKAPKTEGAAAKKPRARAKKAKPRAKKAPKRKAKPGPKAARKLTTRRNPRARRANTPAAEQAKIVATADREGLTALQVQKRFGVKPVTYYSWRKKLGVKGRRGRPPVVVGGAVRGGDLSAQVRAGVQARVREMLPSIVREEVARYLDEILASRSAAKGRRRR